jgi:osmotically-inducible protein OsmY
MANRYEDRHSRGGYRRDRDRTDDRGYMERAGDEVRSWFGDDDAQRRRYMDEQRDREHERQYGSEWDRERNRADWNRSDWQRSERNRSDWDRPRSDWDQSQGWRSASTSEPAPYRESGRTWSSSDWDRERDPRRYDYENRYRTPERSESRNVPISSWSVDEGRTEFGRQRWGRGPKGYQRSDTRIHEDVCDRLTYSDVDAENIEVRVSAGEVTLSGAVRDRWDKRRAEDLVEEVSGVRDVHNNIRVERDTRGIGQSDTSASEQPGTVLGVNPTASSTITSTPPKGTTRS